MLQGAGLLVLQECLKTEASDLGLSLRWLWKWVEEVTGWGVYVAVSAGLLASCCLDI